MSIRRLLLERLEYVRGATKQPSILCLHDVTDAAWFKAYADALAHEFTILPLNELLDRWRCGLASGRELALTWDDGCRSILTIVEPVLRARGIAYTVFVCGGVVAGELLPWFSRLQAIRAALSPSQLCETMGWPAGAVRTWDEFQALVKEAPGREVRNAFDHLERRVLGQARLGTIASAAGFLSGEDVAMLAARNHVTIGNHSYSHPVLGRQSLEDQRSELSMTQAVLTSITGSAPRFVAYPNGQPGDFNLDTFEVLKELGIDAAFTTVQRSVSPDDHRWALPRLGVETGDPVSRLLLKRSFPWISLGMLRESRRRSRMRGLMKSRRIQWPSVGALRVPDA